jgi:heme/copper-type cytochrome/quinol oxidase subunit 4
MDLLRKRISQVWIVLMAITCVSTWGMSKEAILPAAATTAIFLLAALKARLVLMHFMELRNAPPQWRLLFEAWVIVITAAITGIYLQTAGTG